MASVHIPAQQTQKHTRSNQHHAQSILMVLVPSLTVNKDSIALSQGAYSLDCHDFRHRINLHESGGEKAMNSLIGTWTPSGDLKLLCLI
jgi:hypothetical protein